MARSRDHVCPRTGKRTTTPTAGFWVTLATGLASLAWFVVRVGPKPSRAAYPCQRAAAATAVAFLGWLLGAASFGALFCEARRRLAQGRRAILFTTLGSLIGGATWLVLAQPASTASAFTTWSPKEGANAPMGSARGLFPGRVVWAYDPLATRWDGKNGHWWDPEAADQSRIDAMLSGALQSVSGKASDAAAWAALFSSFNERHGRSGGYQTGQKIVIKINQNTARGGHAQNGLKDGDQNPINGNPHVILALLKQLVNAAGVAEDDVIVYDISRYIGDSIFVPCHASFSKVHFVELDSGGGDGREAFDGKWVQNALTFAGQGVGRNLPRFVAEAAYMINLASLKAHGDEAGPTLHAKNHYGTVTGLNHTWPNAADSYSFFVELMGSRYLGENTLLFMIDGIYGAPGADASPARFASYPFSGNYPSSLFLSQDGVASESVGWDFINAEWGVPPGSDNTLHEAATANAPASGTKYAPNGDGVPLPSLGVHEHWNNSLEKRYSRNLGKATGIELVQLFAPGTPIPLIRNGWVASASDGNDSANDAIDGKADTRFTTGKARAADQWFQVNMGSRQTFSELVLDAKGTTDFIGGYAMYVSSNGADWGEPIAQGTATEAKAVIRFPEQSATWFRVVATDSGTHWWSINELNAFTTKGEVSTPGAGGAASNGGSPNVGGASTSAGGRNGNAAGGRAEANGGAYSRGGSAGTAGSNPGGSSPSDANGGATLNAGAPGSSNGGSAAGGTTQGVGANANAPADSSGESGCGCRLVARTGSGASALLYCVALLALARTRKRPRRHRT